MKTTLFLSASLVLLCVTDTCAEDANPRAVSEGVPVASTTVTNAATVSTNEIYVAPVNMSVEIFDFSAVSDKTISRILVELDKSPEWIWAPLTSWSLSSETATTPYLCAWKTAYCPFYRTEKVSVGISLDTRESPRAVNPEREEARVGIRAIFFGKKAKIAKR